MSEELKYPGLPRELDRRVVLTEREIAEMKELRDSGLSSRKIGEMYAVSKTIVLYWTNNQAYRDRVNKKRYDLNATRMKHDPEFKKKQKEESKANIKNNLKRCEGLRKFKGKSTYKWKKKKLSTDPKFRIKTNQQASSAYHRNKNKSK